MKAVLPSQKLLGLMVIMGNVGPEELFTVIETVPEQLAASVTVTVYVPAVITVIESVISPPLHK